VTNLQPDASRAGVQRTLALIFLVVLTALALLLGHSLERLHDAVPTTATTTATVTTVSGDAPVPATAGMSAVEDAATVGGVAELCALLAVVCAVIFMAVALVMRARPGRDAIASTAPPKVGPFLRAAVTQVRSSLFSSSVPLRL